MPDGKLTVTMMLGRRRDTAEVRCYGMISDDIGKTWSSPSKLFEPDESKNPVSAGIRMSKVTDGTLVGFVNLLNRLIRMHRRPIGTMAARFHVTMS